jgi:hypothetical protein
MTASRRLGRFKVTGAFFRNLQPGEGINLFHNMVVLRAEQDMTTDATNYVAMHPDFEEVPEGQVLPIYTASFAQGQIHPKWRVSPHDSF